MKLVALLDDFAVYADGYELVGAANELELPSFEGFTEELDGAGVMGKIVVPATGQFESIVLKVGFANLEEAFFRMADVMRPPLISVYGAQQVIDKETQIMSYQDFRVDARGFMTTHELGKVTKGKKGEPSMEIDCTYYRLQTNGVVNELIDKLNYKYVLNGVDKTAQIRSMLGR